MYVHIIQYISSLYMYIVHVYVYYAYIGYIYICTYIYSTLKIHFTVVCVHMSYVHVYVHIHTFRHMYECVCIHSTYISPLYKYTYIIHTCTNMYVYIIRTFHPSPCIHIDSKCCWFVYFCHLNHESHVFKSFESRITPRSLESRIYYFFYYEESWIFLNFFSSNES